MEKIFNLMKQPTTWAGVTGLLTTLGLAISPELAKEITTIGISVASLLLIWFDENKEK